ncbi:MAG: MotA/TolQ/ExbB proton channel family protein [Candidatus Thiodiazotropha sp. (ex Monitilora ramsayi)]|nr:MotA/TolQ/ExbB proton channel family protein [Candidatus Thiodiazotropha sp. (ex Monitilora ramsayi)]
MGSIQLRRNFSRNILVRMIIMSAVIAALMVWKFEFINQVYFRDQLTSTGLIINGTIVGLFAIGILRMITIFLHYAQEENALIRFLRNLREGEQDPLKRIHKKAIIGNRYRTMQGLFKANCPINHGSLASTLVANESTRNSLPKFINNILILTGVFGTIVSLSIALIGASDLLATSINVGGMGMVVHGMSTALSTTITAIICFIFFGYFNLKLSDVQTNLISAVEQITVNELLPRFQVQTDSALYEFTGLVRSLQELVNQMKQSQEGFEAVEQRVLETLQSYQEKSETMHEDMAEVKHLLKRGFRLHEDD